MVLALKDKIWVDPLEVYRKLINVPSHVVTRSIRIDLLRENLAVDNPKHVDKLYDLCLRSGLQDAIPGKLSQSVPFLSKHDCSMTKSQFLLR